MNSNGLFLAKLRIPFARHCRQVRATLTPGGSRNALSFALIVLLTPRGLFFLTPHLFSSPYDWGARLPPRWLVRVH
jgi:hypothetical protein